MSRRTFVRRAGLGVGTVSAVGAGLLAYRAYDQGVLEAGEGPAYEPWSTWSEGGGLLPLVGAATLAPSSHNAQPWLFALGSDHIDLHADPTRWTGAVDPLHRELHVGLGAALENLVLAARARGLAPHVELTPAGPRSPHAARVTLSDSPAPPDGLYEQIPRRHTNRYPFVEGKGVPDGALSAMAALADGGTPDVGVVWLTTPDERGRAGELLVAATEAIIADADQSASDFQWFRQSWDELQRRRDGITVDASGLADLTAALAKLLPAQSERATADSWLSATRDRHTRTAAAYGIVVARDAGDARQRLQGGRLLERVHLWATGQGLAIHHMNQLTERADREVQLGLDPTFGDAAAQLVPPDWQVLSMFRTGHPTRHPRRSPRRSVDAVVLT